MFSKESTLANIVFQYNVPQASLWKNKSKFKDERKIERNFANKPMLQWSQLNQDLEF